jgi:uncharacterized protein (TIGR02145 family)
MAAFVRPLLAATLGLAITFTLSCGEHSGGDDGGNPSSSSGTSSSSGAALSSSQGGDTVSGSFTDARDGKKYKTVVIGTQTWMAQNLDYHEKWVGVTRGNKCYDNKDDNCEKYGRLYEWEDAIRVCPDGWHLPSNSEWNALISFIGDDAGKKLKSASNYWREGAGTDLYDFGALPGGGLDAGEFKNLNRDGDWWTSTEINTDRSYLKYMNANTGVSEISGSKTSQYSVRCVKGYSSSSSIVYVEFTDERDNQTYFKVKIGAQTWMAQNLNYAGTSSQIGLCYNDETENCNIYGRIYDWATAMNVLEDYNNIRLNASSGQHKGICPDGWHLPTLTEWDTLISFVGDNAGKKLKARSSEWGDNYGTDIYGFGALPGGGYDYDLNGFVNLNRHGNWWTSTESLRGDLDRSHMKSLDADFTEFYGTKGKQYSIRCVED